MHSEITPKAARSPSLFASLADSLNPVLHRWTRRPQRIVSFTPCEDSYFGVKASPSEYDLADLPTLAWGRDADFILDFGIHMVGYLSFRLSCVGANMDAPCRLRLTFGEAPLDVTMGMEGVETWLSRAWLPDEIINVDVCPEDITIRRRHAFRYLRVQVIDTSRNFKVAMSDFACDCVSAVGQDVEFEPFSFDEQLFQDIDRISIMTLRDCMQTVFEDGPRRDRRIWIGDLRLQAMANYSTLKDLTLVKRCILQFAAVAREDGSLPACLFEKPVLNASADYIVEYDALFGSVVHDYVEASGDLETGRLLWATTLQCLKRGLEHVDTKTYLFDATYSKDFKFLDWNMDVDTTAGSHGVLLYSLKAVQKLARLLNLDFPHDDTVRGMTAAATTFLAPDSGLITSGPNAQVSYACASWLVLSGALPPATARAALLATLAHPSAIRPLTPYAWHHVCEALVSVGAHDECLDILRTYWGGMVSAGADTFWECYDPADPRASPYGDVRTNSFCHAWSCTPTVLLRNQLRDRVGGRPAGSMTVREMDEAWIRQTMGKA